ncbi:hypothetical protein LguiA_002006 [Lonicera macranthoides]
MQHNDEEDHVCISIGRKLDGLFPSSTGCFIFKVHDQLRKVNEKAYEPDIISIGPYHHGKNNLQMMEEHKLRYLQYRLREKKESLQRYVVAMRELEGKVRRCYAEPLNLNEDELIEMMLLDGFFIVELVRKFRMSNLRQGDDPIFEVEWIVNSLQHDLLLFENQLPFFVLCKLFDMIEVQDNHKRFIHLTLHFFSDLFPGPAYRGSFDGDQNIKYLLELIHNNWLPSFEESENTDDSKKERNWQFIPSVTELAESGMKFEKIGGNSFDIKFRNGVMQIPTLTIEDRTESFFRNLIAYEEYHQSSYFHFIVDYVKFMDCLIDSPKDVEILCRSGIIDNWLGDDEAVSNMFNKLNDHVTGPGVHFHYAGVFNEVNKHCSKHRNKWMAKLRRSYLDSPWAIIAVLASFVLLVLTLLQTVYTMKG